MKKVVIPLSLILGIIAMAHVLSVMGDMTEKAKGDDIAGVTEILAEEAVDEAKDEVMEPFWVLLLRNPLVWILGAIGSVFGIRFVIK